MCCAQTRYLGIGSRRSRSLRFLCWASTFSPQRERFLVDWWPSLQSTGCWLPKGSADRRDEIHHCQRHRGCDTKLLVLRGTLERIILFAALDSYSRHVEIKNFLQTVHELRLRADSFTGWDVELGTSSTKWSCQRKTRRVDNSLIQEGLVLIECFRLMQLAN